MNKAGFFCMLAICLAFLIAIGCTFLSRQEALIITSNHNFVSGSATTETQSHNIAITNSKLNINLATARDLELLPGIGEALANRIIEYRTKNGPFESINELIEVKGIGAAKLDAIRSYITVD